MERKVLRTEEAPRALGPYSQGIQAGPWVFLSGQLGLDPGTGTLVEGGAAAQAEQALRNIEAILRGAGSGLGKVVRVTLYLADLESFAAVNEVFGRFFREDPPARTTVEVSRLPLGALVEIESQAVL